MGVDADPGYGDRFEDQGPGLRRRTARGAIVNALFMAALASLGFVKGFLVAGFLTTAEFGVWGILIVTLGTLTTLKEIGVGDKFVQQDEPDQELAFQKAFTIDTLVNGVLLVALAIAVPLFALAYDRPELLLPGFALMLAVPAASLHAPVWVFYRQMSFVKQRVVQSVNPLVSFAATIALAAAGFGYWSLVVGTVAGFWIGGIVAAAVSPYRLAFRYDRGTLREYAGFSWPLLVAAAGGILIAQLSLFVGEAELGLAGAGAITLASSIAIYTNRVDQIVTQTLYPAICAVRERTDLLFESFVKSNRLALMWGVPFGVALTLFAPDLVEFAIGSHWEPAVGLLQAFGLIAAADHIGFNWSAFYRARGQTRPMAVAAVVTVVVFAGVAIPLLVAHGLDGLIAGMAITTALSLAVRTYYLTRIFPGFAMATHMLRAISPTIPAVMAVLALRTVESGERTGLTAGGELALYLAVTVVATLAFERALLREVIGYLRGGAESGAPAAA